MCVGVAPTGVCVAVANGVFVAVCVGVGVAVDMLPLLKDSSTSVHSFLASGFDEARYLNFYMKSGRVSHSPSVLRLETLLVNFLLPNFRLLSVEGLRQR